MYVLLIHINVCDIQRFETTTFILKYVVMKFSKPYKSSNQTTYQTYVNKYMLYLVIPKKKVKKVLMKDIISNNLIGTYPIFCINNIEII